MKRAIAGVALALFAALACGSASARSPYDHWLEIQSPHFTVYTDGSASDARDVAKHFELIREVFLKMWPKLHVDPPEPVVILAVRNGRDLQTLLPGFWTKGHMHPAGIFVTALDRNYIALRMDVSQYDGYHVVYHEYVHLLERLNFSRLPVWVSEGLAEFYAAAQIDGDDVALGRPMADHIELLRQGKWIPLDELLTATHSSPFYNENNLSSVFYAESWELTHYLLTADNGAHQKILARYDELYEEGVPSLDAARQAFGDLNALTKQLQRYPYQVTYNYLRVKTTIAANKAKYSSEAITPAEAEAVAGDFYVRTQRPVEARTALQQAIQLDPKLPAPYASLGMLAMEQRDTASAQKWFHQAIALGSKDYLVYYDDATLSLFPMSSGDLSGPIGDLNRCVDLNPNFSFGYQLLAQLYARRDVKLALADSLVRRAIVLDPTSSLNHLTLGLVLMRQQMYNEAETEAKTALSLARDDVERERAQSFLFTVQQNRAMAQRPSGEIIYGPAGGPVSSPLLIRRPERVTPTSGVAPGASATAAPSTAATGFVPRAGMLIADGPVRNASCVGNTIRFLLMVGGKGVPLFAADADTVYFSGFPALQNGSSRCVQIEKQQVTVGFMPVGGQQYTGTILEITLRHPNIASGGEPPAGEQPAPAKTPTASSASAATAKANSSAASLSNVYLIPQATVLKANCSGKTLRLWLNVRGSKMNLFAPDTGTVGYEGMPGSVSGTALCALLEKRHVAVWFRPVHGKQDSGTIVGIDLKR